MSNWSCGDRSVLLRLYVTVKLAVVMLLVQVASPTQAGLQRQIDDEMEFRRESLQTTGCSAPNTLATAARVRDFTEACMNDASTASAGYEVASRRAASVKLEHFALKDASDGIGFPYSLWQGEQPCYMRMSPPYAACSSNSSELMRAGAPNEPFFGGISLACQKMAASLSIVLEQRRTGDFGSAGVFLALRQPGLRSLEDGHRLGGWRLTHLNGVHINEYLARFAASQVEYRLQPVDVPTRTYLAVQQLQRRRSVRGATHLNITIVPGDSSRTEHDGGYWNSTEKVDLAVPYLAVRQACLSNDQTVQAEDRSRLLYENMEELVTNSAAGASFLRMETVLARIRAATSLAVLQTPPGDAPAPPEAPGVLPSTNFTTYHAGYDTAVVSGFLMASKKQNGTTEILSTTAEEIAATGTSLFYFDPDANAAQAAGVSPLAVDQLKLPPITILSLPTFLPPALSSCRQATATASEILATASPSQDDVQSEAAQRAVDGVSNCLAQAAASFLRHASGHTREHAESYRSQRILLDLRGNRGGSIVLAAALASHLLHGTVAPLEAFLPPVVLRRHPAMVSVVRWLQGQIEMEVARGGEAGARARGLLSLRAVLPLSTFGTHRLGLHAGKPSGGLASAGAEGDATQQSASLGSISPSDFSWYTDATRGLSIRGAKGALSNFSDVVSPVALSDAMELLRLVTPERGAEETGMDDLGDWGSGSGVASPPPQGASTPLTPGGIAPGRIVLLTDGLCGAACAQFLRSMARRGCKVLATGGWENMPPAAVYPGDGVTVPSLKPLLDVEARALALGWEPEPEVLPYLFSPEAAEAYPQAFSGLANSTDREQYAEAIRGANASIQLATSLCDHPRLLPCDHVRLRPHRHIPLMPLDVDSVAGWLDILTATALLGTYKLPEEGEEQDLTRVYVGLAAGILLLLVANSAAFGLRWLRLRLQAARQRALQAAARRQRKGRSADELSLDEVLRRNREGEEELHEITSQTGSSGGATSVGTRDEPLDQFDWGTDRSSDLGRRSSSSKAASVARLEPVDVDGVGSKPLPADGNDGALIGPDIDDDGSSASSGFRRTRVLSGGVLEASSFAEAAAGSDGALPGAVPSYLAAPSWQQLRMEGRAGGVVSTIIEEEGGQSEEDETSSLTRSMSESRVTAGQVPAANAAAGVVSGVQAETGSDAETSYGSHAGEAGATGDFPGVFPPRPSRSHGGSSSGRESGSANGSGQPSRSGRVAGTPINLDGELSLEQLLDDSD